jgi:hypothetical protein
VSHMSLLRPEIDTFLQAATVLIERDVLSASLSEDEEIALAQCLTRQFFSRGFIGDGCSRL